MAAAPSPSVGPLTTQYFQFVTEADGRTTSYLATVQWRSDGTQLHLTTSIEPEYGGAPAETGTLSGPIGSYFAGRLPGNLTVAVIPDEVNAVEHAIDTDAPNPPIYADLQVRPDHNNGFTLVVLRQEPAGAMPVLTWLGSDGAAHNSAGEVLQSLSLTVDNAELTVVQKPDGTRWSTFPTDVVRLWRTTDPDQAEVRVMMPRPMSVGRLPVGATAVTVTPRDGGSWTVGMMADGRLWYLVVRAADDWTNDSSTTSLVKSISYTDANGERVIYRPTLRY